MRIYESICHSLQEGDPVPETAIALVMVLTECVKQVSTLHALVDAVWANSPYVKPEEKVN